MNQVTKPTTSFTHPDHHKPDSAILLEILTTTLKESWGILLYVEWPESYGLELDYLDEHWGSHAKTIQEFLKDHGDSDNSFVGDYKVGALQLLHELLIRELRVQSTLQQDVHSMLEESLDDSDVREPLTSLLGYLHITQAALLERLEFIRVEIEIANDRTKNLVHLSESQVQSAAA